MECFCQQSRRFAVSKTEWKSNSWHKCCKKNIVQEKIILKSWKKFSRELKNETINADVSHGKMLELEIRFKGLFDNIPEKDA